MAETKTLTLVDFLEARLDEDVSGAHECDGMESWLGPEAYIYDLTRRVLREVEVKRAILNLHRSDSPTPYGSCVVCADEEDSSEDSEGERMWHRSGQSWPCRTVRALATVYSGHPDYREEWLT